MDARDIQVVNTIAQQIQANKNVFWSWGSHKLQRMMHNNMPTLIFLVNGFKHKGYVLVSYSYGKDLYEVSIAKKHEGKLDIIETVEDVYDDMLVDVIDRMVETDNDKSDDYHNKVSGFMNLIGGNATLEAEIIEKAQHQMAQRKLKREAYTTKQCLTV